jgi:phytoene dehydrogenase-like protein
MEKKSIIIIGAGLAGLSTGYYSQVNGYKTQIFEMQNKPGGVCVSWKRNGYSFDYAVHNIFGFSSEPTKTVENQLWRELGAFGDSGVYTFEEFVQVEDNGKTFTAYGDVDRLERHLKELAPNDAKLIEEFTGTIRKLRGQDIFGAMFGGWGAKLKMLPFMNTLMKYGKMSLKDFAEKFSDPFLRKAFPTIQYDLEGVPVLCL